MGSMTTEFELTLVGDRGMITSARIAAQRKLGGLSWITCLRAPAIKALAADDGPLQMSPVRHRRPGRDQPPGLPRLIACRNPALAAERPRTRRTALAPLTPHRRTPPARANPVTPAVRSTHATSKAGCLQWTICQSR
jgi:hypothetical protein